MASVTLSLPDDLVSQIRAQQQQLPRILELGLRELNAAGQSGFDGAADVLELLAALPPPEEILNLRPSKRLSARVTELVDKSRAGQMTPLDEEDWERYEYLEHLVRMAKAAAQLKLTPSAGVVRWRYPIAMPHFDSLCACGLRVSPSIVVFQSASRWRNMRLITRSQ
jgi:hypothetical protein